MTDENVTYAEMDVTLSFSVPEKPSHIDQETYEWRVMQATLDSIIDRVVIRFIDIGFNDKIVAACLLSTLSDSLAHNAILLEIPKKDLIRGVEMMFDDRIMHKASNHEAGNA
jgi:hypothetical protein